MSLRYALHEEHVYRPFVSADQMVYAPTLPEDSLVRGLCLRPMRATIRPWSPEGLSPGGIWVERHHRHPRMWAWVLSMTRGDVEQYGIAPGAFVLFKRFAGEYLGDDLPAAELYIGEKYPVELIRLDQWIAQVEPPPMELPL